MAFPAAIKSVIEFVSVIASIFVIFSVLFAVAVYSGQQEIVQENNEIILQNAIEEINLNLGFIDTLKNKKEEFLQNNTEFPAGRYEHHFLSESLSIVKNRDVRKDIITTIKNLKQLNVLLDASEQALFVQWLDKEYINIKNVNFERISDTHETIEIDLGLIKQGLQEEIDNNYS